MNIKEIIYNFASTPVRFIKNIIESPALVLIYHRVIDLVNDSQQLAVKPDNFFRQIEYLKKNYNLIKVEEFSELLAAGKGFPPKSILLTFDDGYADNCLNALPILESLDVESLFYITTSLIGSNSETWWDNLEKIFITNTNLPSSLTVKINNSESTFITSNKAHIQKTYAALHPLLKYTKAQENNSIMQQLFEWSGITSKARPTHRFLNAEELKKMSDSKSVVIGAHTHTHTPLSILTADEQQGDIRTSLETIQKITGNSPKHFSYPFGVRKDYNNDTLKICRNFGFKFVCANYYSQVHSWTDPYQVPRILIRNWDFETFKNKITKFFKY